MADRRLQLHSELIDVIGTDRAYFQPPEDLFIQRPCIKYTLSNMRVFYADNNHYERVRAYQLILVDENPDSEYVDKLLDKFVTGISLDRTYIFDSLNHWVFTLYY